MTHEELESYWDRFNEIMKGKEPVRTKRLKTLLNDLEQTYHVPALYSADYEFHNQEVMKLYRNVSVARNF